MATIEKRRVIRRKESAPPQRRILEHPAVIWPVVLICVGAAVWWLLSLRKPPQMGANAEVFKTVDALFTAVTAHDEKLLEQCETRLREQRDAGKISAEPAEYLDNVINKARAGNWQSAGERLYDFMRAQKREGAEQEPARPKLKKRSVKK
jgi:hypothetical protein